MDKQYRYFISFSHMTLSGCGFGCCEFILKNRITNMDDVIEMTKYLERQKQLKDVCILNFQLLEEA